MNKGKAYGLILEWIILLVCFGYPMQAMVIAVIKTDSAPINIGFRSIYMMLSLFMIFYGIKGRTFRINWPFVFFTVFWIFYGMRIIYNTEINGVTYMYENKWYVYGFAFGNTLIPTLAVFSNYGLINIERISKNLFRLLLITNISIAISLVIFSSDGFNGIYSQRASLIVPINGEMVNIINAITISFHGSLLSIMSLIMILFTDGKRPKQICSKLFFAICFLLGISVLLAGASKGPLVSFVILIVGIVALDFIVHKRIYYLLLSISEILKKLKSNTLSVKYVLQFILLVFTISIIFYSFYYFIHISKEIAIFERLKDFIKLPSGTYYDGRYALWQSAFAQIKEYPIFGDRFLTNFLNSSSHNLFIDALMATGITGTIIFIFYIFSPIVLFRKLKSSSRIKFLALGLIFLNIFFISNVSGGIWNSSNFWIFSALLITLFYDEIGNNTKISQVNVEPVKNIINARNSIHHTS